MTAAFDEAALRHWLVDYLVTNVGCSPDDIDLDASMHDLGVGSANEFSETSRITVAEPDGGGGGWLPFPRWCGWVGVTELRVTSRLRRRVHCGGRIG
jgi:hypothetical protein